MVCVCHRSRFSVWLTWIAIVLLFGSSSCFLCDGTVVPFSAVVAVLLGPLFYLRRLFSLLERVGNSVS